MLYYQTLPADCNQISTGMYSKEYKVLTALHDENLHIVGEHRPEQASILLGFGPSHFSSGNSSTPSLDCLIQVILRLMNPLPQLAEQSSAFSTFHLRELNKIIMIY